MSDSPTFPCGCAWQYRREPGSYRYREVHTPECRERSLARHRRYAEELHRKYDTVNTVIIPAVPIILEDVPADDEPDLSDVETQRPDHIPPLDVSLAAARVFASDDSPPAEDWAKVCAWWWCRKLGLLHDGEQD
jgi:hypothetical protein